LLQLSEISINIHRFESAFVQYAGQLPVNKIPHYFLYRVRNLR